MLRIDRQQKRFESLPAPALADVAFREVGDLQKCIANNPDAFFGEIGQKLFLLKTEVHPSQTVQDRIDLLALDEEGNSVVIELKRDNHKLHLLQAISYAAMIAHWQPNDFLELLDESGVERLENFLEEDKENINRRQKIILIAEAFDYSVLVSAEWLSENFGVDIVCCRLSLSKDEQTDTEYLVCTNVFPAPEIARQAIARGRMNPPTSEIRWSDWDTALSDNDNPAVTSYFRQALVTQESNLGKRILWYRINDKRYWFVSVRNGFAYAWQYARFAGDIQYWQERLSHPEDVCPVKAEKSLRFRLYTEKDFENFHKAATNDLQTVQWLSSAPDNETDQVESDLDEQP